MRVLAACLVGFLGLGALATMGACSDSTDAGSAGAGGAAGGSVAGSGGKAPTAGSTSEAGADEGGAAECGFRTVDCSGCIADQCGTEATACTGDCGTALYALPECVCDPAQKPSTCIDTFVADNGDPAAALADCFNKNCATACK